MSCERNITVFKENKDPIPSGLCGGVKFDYDTVTLKFRSDSHNLCYHSCPNTVDMQV